MSLNLKAYLLVITLAFGSLQTQALSLKDFFSIEKLKILNYLDVSKTPENNGWLRTVTVKIPAQLDLAGLATSQIPLLEVSSDKNSEVTFMTWFPSEKEADNILSFVDYLNKIPYRAEQITDNFAIGEEIRFKTKLSFLTGLNAVPKLILTPVSLKGNTIVTGEFSVNIKKISATEVELSYTNVNDQEKGITGNVGTNTNFKFIKIDSQLNVSLLKYFPRLMDFANTDNTTYSRTQSFKIDLSSENGKSFYNKLLASSLITENLKSLLEKRTYKLEEIKKLYIDPYQQVQGVDPKEFGSLNSNQWKQKFSIGWVFKKTNTQSYRRLWYQHQNEHQEISYYLVDEFQVTLNKTNLFGFGSQQDEKRIGKALYQADAKGNPLRFVELQLNSSLDVKSKNTHRFIKDWENRLQNNFYNTPETTELTEILKLISDKKQTVNASIKFTVKDVFFYRLQESLVNSKTKKQALKEITHRINSYMDKLQNVRILTPDSCVGKICDLFRKNKTPFSQLYEKEIRELAESIYELTKNRLSLKEKSKELAELRKNPLFADYPIGVLTSLLPEEVINQSVAFELTAKNGLTEESKSIKFGYNNSLLSKNLMSTIKFLQGEAFSTTPLNRCLIYY